MVEGLSGMAYMSSEQERERKKIVLLFAPFNNMIVWW